MRIKLLSVLQVVVALLSLISMSFARDVESFDSSSEYCGFRCSRTLPAGYHYMRWFHQKSNHPQGVVPKRCAHSSVSMQELVKEVKDEAERVEFGTQFTKMKSVIVNQRVLYRPRLCCCNFCKYHIIKMDACSSSGNHKYIVDEGERQCSSHEKSQGSSKTQRTKVFSAVDLAMKSIERHLKVMYVQGNGPIGVGSDTEECKLDSDYRTLDFRDAEYNTGIVVTMTPFKPEKPWVDQLAWALPCAYTDKKRPFLIRVNINPAVVDLYTRDEMIPILQHQIIHGLGFQELNDVTKNYDYLKPIPEGKTDIRYWDKDGGDYSTNNYFDCDKKYKALVMDEELLLRNSSTWEKEYSKHFESKFVWNDIMANNPGGNSVRLTIRHFAKDMRDWYRIIASRNREESSSINLGDEYYKTLDSGNSGTVTIGTLVRDSIPLQDAGCDVMIGHRCNTTTGGRFKHFCFPPTPKIGKPESFKSCNHNRTAKAKCGLYEHDHEIGSIYRYYHDFPTLGGEVEADYCPKPVVPAVEETCNPGQLPSQANMIGFGESFGSNSRCFESTAKQDSYVITQELHLRCFEVRCPFKTRIEFKLQKDSTWRKCPDDGSAGSVTLATGTHNGYVGTVSCPAAADICDDSLLPPPPEPNWKRVPGYRIEYGVVPGARGTFAKAKEICAVYTNNSRLAFLPDANFSATVAKNVLEVMPSYPSFWTGATASPSTWVDMQGYAHSALTIPPATEKCWFINTGSTDQFASGGCDTERPIVCTRSIEERYDIAGCGFSKICTAQNTTHPMMARDYYVPINDNWTSVTTGQEECDSNRGTLFNFDRIDDSGSVHGVMTKLASIFESTDATPLLGLWTGLNITAGVDGNTTMYDDALWKPYVLDWPTQGLSEGDVFCLMLVHSTDSTGAFPMQLKPWKDCAVKFPSLCYQSNTPNSVHRFPGFTHTFRLFEVKASRFDAEAICTLYNETLSLPINKEWHNRIMLISTSHLANRDHMENDQVKWSYHVGVTKSGSTITRTNFNSFPYSTAGLDAMNPTSAYVTANFDGEDGAMVVGNWWATDTPTMKIRDATAERFFGCSDFDQNVTFGDKCANGTFCWDRAGDNEMMLVHSPPLSASDAGAECVRRGGLPLLAPPLVLPSWKTSFENLFPTTALTIAWTGMTYSASDNAFFANGSVVSGLDPSDGSLMHNIEARPLVDGDCIAVFFTSSGTLKLKPLPCDFSLPYACRKPLAGSDWVAFSPTSGSNKQYFLEYTALLDSTMDHPAAMEQCDVVDGKLAYFQPLSGDAFFIGNLFNGAPTWVNRELWFGLITTGTGAYPKGYNDTFGHTGFSEAQKDLITPECFIFTVDGGNAFKPENKSCADKFSPMCARYIATLNYSLPASINAGNEAKLTVVIPDVPDIFTKAGVSVTSNVSGVVVEDKLLSVNDNNDRSVAFTPSCDVVTEPTYAGFTMTVLKANTTTGVRTTTTHINGAKSVIIWPCHNFTSSPTKFRQMEGTTAQVNISTPTQMRADSKVTLTIYIENSTVLGVDDAQVMLSAADPFKIVTFNGKVGGTSSFSTSLTSCSPADTCVTTTEKQHMGSFEFWPTSQISHHVIRSGTQGADNTVSGNYIQLLHDPAPANVTITLDAGNLFLTPSEFANVTAFEKLYFNFTSGVADSFNLTADVNITNTDEYNTTDVFVPVFDGVYDLGEIVVEKAFPLTIYLNESRSLFYPGEKLNLVVETSAEAVNNSEWIDVLFAVADAYLFVDPDTGNAPGLTPLPTENNTNPATSSPKHTPTVNVRKTSCCSYGIELVALPQVSPLISLLATNTTTDYTAKFSPSTSGGHMARFPLPRAMPEFTLRVRKHLVLGDVPSVFKTGGEHFEMILGIAQAPSMIDIVVNFTCNISTTTLSPNVSQIVFKADQFIALGSGDDQDIEHAIDFHATANGWSWRDSDHKAAGEIARCEFNFSSGYDVFQTPFEPFQVNIYPRADLSILSHVWEEETFQLPRIVSPNTTFYIALLRGDPYDPNLRTNQVVVSVHGAEAYGVKAKQFANEIPYPSGGTWYPVQVDVAADAPANKSICVTFTLNNYMENEEPPSACFEIVPIVEAKVQPVPAALSFAQPVGDHNSQEVWIGITSVPTFADVNAEVYCMPSETMAGIDPSTIAQFSRTKFTFKMNAAKNEPQSFTIVGLTPNTDCVLGVNMTGGPEFKNITGLSLLPESLVFVSLLSLDAKQVGFTDAIYVGQDNKKMLQFSLTRPPSKPLTAVLTSSDVNVVINPTTVVFLNTSNERLTKQVDVHAVRVLPSYIPNVTITVEIVSDAKEVHPDRFRRVTFGVNPLIQTVVRQLENALFVVKHEHVYCSGGDTAITVNVTISDLPISNSTRAMISLAPVNRSEPEANRLVAIPSVAAFSRVTRNILSVPVKLQCAQGLPRGAKYTIPMATTVAAPPEFAPGGTFKVSMYALEYFNVTFGNFDTRDLVVGAPVAVKIIPSTAPPKGERLELDFITSCGNAISTKSSNIGGSTALVWDDSNYQESRGAPVSFVITATRPVTACSLSLSTAKSTTVHNFEFYAFRTVVQVVDVPRIRAMQDDGPHLTEADLHGGFEMRFTVTDQTFAISREMVAKRAPVERSDAASATLSSSRIASAGTFIDLFENDPGNTIKFEVQQDGRLMVKISAPSSFTVQVPEDITVQFTANILNSTQNDPALGYDTFNFTLVPQEEDIAKVQKGIAATAVSAMLLASPVAGAVLGTQGAKLAVLLDAGKCPILDWVETKQDDLDFIENPFNVRIGSITNLGVYMGAAIMNLVVIGAWYTLHLVIVFIVFAYRRDQNVGDRSVARALATMRFPALDAFIVVYFTPIIVEQALRVGIYSPNTMMRVFGALICAGVGGGVIYWLRSVVMNPHIDYIHSGDNRGYTLLQKTFYARGKYVIARPPPKESAHASEIRHAAINKYGLIVEDFAGDRKHMLLIDVVVTVLISVLNAYEPLTKKSCIIKYAIMTAFFLGLLVVTVVLRPYRRHSWNIFFIVIAFTQFVSIGVSLGLIVGATTSARGAQAANISMVIVGNLIILKCLMDMFGVCFKQIFKATGRGKKNKKHRFIADDDPLHERDVFPELRQNGLDDNEWDDTLLGDELDPMGPKAKNKSKLQVPKSQSEMAAEQRKQDLMEMI